MSSWHYREDLQDGEEWGTVSFFHLIYLTLYLTFYRAKYGLAVINHLLQAHGNDIGLVQDTSCAFSKTVATSNFLGDRAQEARLQICVNTFHGYAHSHLCQLQYHPLYRIGFRFSDLEVMEQVFLMLNAHTCHPLCDTVSLATGN